MHACRVAALLALLVVAPPGPRSARAQAPGDPARGSPGDDAVAAVTSLAARDPEGALRDLERRLRADPGPAARRALQLLRPRVLLAAARRDEAREAWRALAAHGEAVEPDLLALEGAALEVAPASAAVAGAPLRLTLRGARTGPVALRLYRVDAARLRAALAADRARPLGAHLRAPPAAALARVAAWDLPPLGADGAATAAATATPARLGPGPWLVTATARGVTVPLPVLVGSTAAVTLRGAGDGALVLADAATAAPVAGLVLEALDAGGLPLGPLGVTDARGLLRFGGAPASALGWRGDAPVVVDLPAPRAGPAAPPPAAALDLPARRPGAPVRGRLVGLAPGRHGEARLLDPRGAPLAAAPLVADRTGQALVDLPLPATAAPGAWALEAGGLRVPVEVAPAPPPVALALDAPAAVTGPRLVARARARLASGAPLAGRVVRWRVVAARASPLAPRDLGPLPPFALRRAAGAPEEVVALGSARVDARGEAAIDAALPAPGGPTLLRLDAALDLGGGHAAAARAHLAAAPTDLLLAVDVDRTVVAPGEQVAVVVRAARLDGTPAAVVDLSLALPGGAVRALRTGPDGAVRTTALLEAAGPATLVARAADAAGRPVVAAAEVLCASRSLVSADAPPPADPAGVRLVLEDAPAAGGAAGVLVVTPFAGGWALAGVEDGQGGLVADVVPVARGVARLEVAPPGAAVVAALVSGRPATARLAVPAPRPALALAVTAAGGEGPEAALAVRVTAEGGRGRVASVVADLHDEATARHLARGAVDAAPGDAGWPWSAPPPLRALARATDETNGEGVGRLRLPRPAAGRAWARVVARDARGAEAEAWCAVDGPPPGLAVRVEGPAHLVVGDAADLVVVVTGAGLEGDGPPVGLRLAWTGGAGLRVGAPRPVAARPLLLGDPGPSALRVAAGPEVRVVVPVEAAADGPPGPRPRPAALCVTATLEAEGGGAGAGAVTTREVAVWGRGVPAAWSAGGALADGVAQQVALGLPEGAVPGAAVLGLAVTPDAATAALAGLAALDDAQDPLVVPLARLAAARRLAAVLGARLLRPPGAPPADDPAARRAALAAALAARGPDGAWGPRTPAVVAALAALEAPAEVLAPALRALAAGGGSDEGAAAWALAAAGALDPARAPWAGDAPDDRGQRAAPDDRAWWAAALHLAGAPAAQVERALAAALDAEDAGPARLESGAARAALARALLARGVRPGIARELLEGALLARAGPGWDDVDHAAQALALLADVAAAAPDAPGVEVAAALEGRPLLAAWTGDGLSGWPGAATLAGAGVGRRARLTLSSRGGPATWSARVDALAPRPPTGLVRRVLRLGADGAAPVALPEEGAVVGEVVRLEVEAAPGAAAVALPLPGGARVLRAPPASVLAAPGVLVAPAAGGPVAVDVLLEAAGALRLRPARAGLATSDERVLRVRDGP